jgi:hypothetical protein
MTTMLGRGAEAGSGPAHPQQNSASTAARASLTCIGTRRGRILWRYSLSWILAQVSRRETVRLKTSAPSRESESTQK